MPLVKKPMNLDETQQEIVAKLDAIKEAILGGGGSAELKIFESLEAVEAAIQSGVLKNGDAAIIKNDSVNIIGASDISAIADGTLTGAAVQLNNDIAEIMNFGDINQWDKLYEETTNVNMTIDISSYRFLYIASNGGSASILIHANSMLIPVSFIPLLSSVSGCISIIDDNSYISITGNNLHNMKVTSVKGGAIYGLK